MIDKRSKMHIVKDRSKRNNNSKINKNETIVIADSLVKRIICHFTRLCMCDKAITHFI